MLLEVVHGHLAHGAPRHHHRRPRRCNLPDQLLDEDLLPGREARQILFSPTVSGNRRPRPSRGPLTWAVVMRTTPLVSVLAASMPAANTATLALRTARTSPSAPRAVAKPLQQE